MLGMANIDCYMQIDFNLYGMGLLRLCNVLFRHPVPEAQHTRQGWAESPALVPPEGAVFAAGIRTAPLCVSPLPYRLLSL